MTADGLEAVFLTNRAALLRFLRARGGGDDAEDLLQELWLKVSRGDSGPIAAPAAYLYRMANNLVLDRRRSLERAMRRDREWASGGDMIDEASSAPSPERVVAGSERFAIADRALDSLGARTAAIFRRFRLDGAGQREIAAEQGISLSAVEKHLQRAYRAMIEVRARLDAEPPAPQRPDTEGTRDVAR